MKREQITAQPVPRRAVRWAVGYALLVGCSLLAGLVSGEPALVRISTVLLVGSAVLVGASALAFWSGDRS